MAALSSSPELEALKREYEAIFSPSAATPWRPCTGRQHFPGWVTGDAGRGGRLVQAAASGEISREEAQQELLATILAMVNRGRT
jgi:hypothetical protein